LRIGLIGLDQRLRQGVGAGPHYRAGSKAHDDTDSSCHAMQGQVAPKHAPSREAAIPSGIPNHVTL
jgi:hypothetical protein